MPALTDAAARLVEAEARYVGANPESRRFEEPEIDGFAAAVEEFLTLFG